MIAVIIKKIIKIEKEGNKKFLYMCHPEFISGSLNHLNELCSSVQGILVIETLINLVITG